MTIAIRGTRVCVYGGRMHKILATSYFRSKPLQSQPKKWLLISNPLSRFLKNRYVLITHIMTKLNNFFDIKLKKASLSGKKLS